MPTYSIRLPLARVPWAPSAGRSTRARLAAGFALCLVCGPAALAQVDTGSLSGIVRDPLDAVIPSARVQVLDVATGVSLESRTNGEGFYSVPDLKPSLYNITVAAAGFRPVTTAGIALRVQDRVEIDFKLEVGQSNTAIVVDGESPLLETGTSSLGQVVEGRQMMGLPLNGRNYIELATLGAGTSPSQRTQERNAFVANGARPIQNSYLLDGIDNKNKIMGFDSAPAQSIEPPVDAIGEFKVQTANFSAEFGQSAGAVVNATIRSGTSQFHGSLFEFVRNSFFDATPYFQPPNGASPSLTQNQFGATLGGPVIRNRTFFFVAWQSSREVNAAPQLALVPSAANLAGRFTQTIFDPATSRPSAAGTDFVRDPFPGKAIPATRFDPVAARLATLYPASNLSGKANFYSDQKEAISADQFLGRVDHRFGARDNFFSRYLTVAGTDVLPAPLPPPANDVSINQPGAHSFAASETHFFHSNLVNEARAGYQQTGERQHADAPRLFDQYGILGAPDIAAVTGLPLFNISGFTPLGTAGPGALPTPATGSGNLPVHKEGRTIQVSDNLAWIHSRHTLKTGFDFQQVTLYSDTTLYARPVFGFNGVYTQDPQNRSATGSPFADFLLGLTYSAQVSTQSVSEVRQHIYQAYIQDDWNATSRLTLNTGLRYELPLPFYETSDNYANAILEPGPYYGAILDAHQLAGTGYRRSFSDPNWHNLAPRVGLAYRLGGSTVIRAAFGLFFGRDENLGPARRPTNNPPYYIFKNYVSDQVHPGIVLAHGLPANALDPAAIVTPGVNSFLRHAPTPYVQQWSFNVQRLLPGRQVFQLAYVGSSAHDLYYGDPIDTPAPGPGNIQARRPLPQFSSVSWYAPFISSNYESLQAQLERRFGAGFGLLAAYTWAHSLDNGSSNADRDGFTPQNPWDFHAERGNSNFDVRHRLSVSTLWDLPFGKGKPMLRRGVPAALGGGWRFTGIYSAQSGLPFTPVLSTDLANTGNQTRPNRIASGLATHPTVQAWFNVAAFPAPARYTYGNSGRNILTGPGYRNLDAGLDRFFTFTERVHLEFRAEAFNLFNTPQLGLPNPSLGVGGTAVISTVIHPQRELQLALRLRF